MKPSRSISRTRRASGVLLLECLVYFVLFTIVLGGATTAFYICWNHSAALIRATGQIQSAIQMGERWRADVRAATGRITVQTNATGEIVQIPEGARVVSYRFESGNISRRSSAAGQPSWSLAHVNKSNMELDARGDVTAWRWELELVPARKETHLPLRFTFEAVTKAKP
jgi:hypothetical protein